MEKFNSLIFAGLVAGLFSSGTAMAADPAPANETPLQEVLDSSMQEGLQPKGDDVETMRKQIKSEAGVHDLETIGKKTNNPVGSAWMMWFQNDFTVMDGDASEHEENWNSFKLQPVMSFPFKMGGDPWNFIVRPVFQFQSFSFAGDRTTGFGDIAMDIAIGPDRTDGVIWGLGVANIFPTASEDEVGQDKWQAGPAVLLAHLAPKVGGFNVGFFAQHFWSYAGDDDRPDTSLTDIQYFIQYRLSKTETLGMAPNIQYDWEADSDNALKLPIGFGYQNVTKVGNTPIKYGLEFQYYVVQPDDFGPVWNVRFIFVPVIQSPF
ncbi:MAG TPA: hypothetical protein EYG88_12740 [Desulfocapsa sulfexigens]|nr:hypothetical protein [Desulfocapsa sulfexigens]